MNARTLSFKTKLGLGQHRLTGDETKPQDRRQTDNGARVYSDRDWFFDDVAVK